MCAIGSVPGLVFWIQERLPGHVLDPGTGGLARAAVAAVLPRLLELNDAQRGLGTGPDSWPGLIARTLASGGDGYCLHATLQASRAARDMLPVLRRIGDRCCPAIPAGTNFVHYDFTPANLLSDGTAITGVIDINPPVLAGDRAFDLATLLFYCYDHDQARTTLTARLLEVGRPASSQRLPRAHDLAAGRLVTAPPPGRPRHPPPPAPGQAHHRRHPAPPHGILKLSAPQQTASTPASRRGARRPAPCRSQAPATRHGSERADELFSSASWVDSAEPDKPGFAVTAAADMDDEGPVVLIIGRPSENLCHVSALALLLFRCTARAWLSPGGGQNYSG